MPQASSFTLPPSYASWYPSKTLYWLLDHVDQTHDEWCHSNKKTINITFTFEWQLHLFQHHRHTTMLHQLLWHFSESFYWHLSDQTAPDWLWHGSLFGQLSADVAHILLQHDASSVIWSKLFGTNFTTACFFRNFMATIFSNYSIHFLNVMLLTWKAVQIWDHLLWMFCLIWNAGATHDIVYGSNNPPHKPVATCE